MDKEKMAFLQTGMFEAFASLQATTPGRWGLMNAQQMLEHLADFFDVSTEKLVFPLSVPEEHLPKYKAFLYSDKDFRENTRAPENVLGEIPAPEKFESIEAAKQNLQRSVQEFVQFFKSNPGKYTLHPAFGMLNFEEWVLLHFKHVKHHLKQFGLATA
ncbi:MAG: DUF1569 domain-containing protein [Chitinophagaceae bacterium]|nr:MAG: DUF1569 domain-containing protein [Chitinophagaceae bacterium]